MYSVCRRRKKKSDVSQWHVNRPKLNEQRLMWLQILTHVFFIGFVVMHALFQVFLISDNLFYNSCLHLFKTKSAVNKMNSNRHTMPPEFRDVCLQCATPHNSNAFNLHWPLHHTSPRLYKLWLHSTDHCHSVSYITKHNTLQYDSLDTDKAAADRVRSVWDCTIYPGFSHIYRTGHSLWS